MTAARRDKAEAPKSLIVFAGPNGSGKSTVNAEFLSNPQIGFDGVYINADDIAKSLTGEFPDARARNIAAAEIAEARRLECLDSGKSFAFETVMSTPEKVALLSQARARGYQVTLVFVTTSDPEINVSRVANRVAMGGHPVPVDSIRARYSAAMQLLPVAIEQADTVMVYDNSRDDEMALRVAQKFNRGELSFMNGPFTPEWVTERLQRDYVDRLESLATLAGALQAEGHKVAPRVELAEAVNGATYAGRMVALTSVHLLQEVQKERFLVHARALTQDRSYRVGRSETVSYAYERGKIVPLDRDQDR